MFDIVIAMEILEHTINCEYLIKKIYSYLKPKGRLLITIPDEHYVDTLNEHNGLTYNELNIIIDNYFDINFSFHKDGWYFWIAVK